MKDESLRAQIVDIVSKAIFQKCPNGKGATVTQVCEEASDALEQLVKSQSRAAVQEVIIEMVHLSDQIELDYSTPEMEEWKAFKHFRNTMRDRYGITADMVPYQAALRKEGDK